MNTEQSKPGEPTSTVLEQAGLRQSLNTVLRPLDTSVKQRQGWQRVSSRLAASRARRGPSAILTGAWLRHPWLSLAFGVTLVLAVGVWFGWTGNAARQALYLANGDAFAGLKTDAATPQRAQFEDGSTIVASGEPTEVQALAMTERDVVMRLVYGSIDVHVAKGGARRWLIEAGEVSVEVVGTRFRVVRSEWDVSVRVDEGVVLVRSAKLPDRVERLTPGQQRVVSVKERHQAARVMPIELDGAAAREPAVDVSPTSVDVPAPRTLPRAPSELLPRPDQVTVLLQRADEARLRGDLTKAHHALQQVVQAHSGDVRSGLAAYQLAVVRQQQGAAAAELVGAFALALQRARSNSLRQDCFWRLALAQEQAGQHAAARSTAHAALRDYPNGRHAEGLRRKWGSSQNSPLLAPSEGQQP